MSDKVILYDLPSKDNGNGCWSLNPWKTRLALNYKQIPYTTTWIQYPDIEPTFKGLGLAPQPEEIKPYTVPAVVFPDGKAVMNSRLIIDELEKRYPERPLRVDDPATEKVQALVRETMGPLTGVLIPNVATKCLTDASRPYFEDTRREMFGMTLEEVRRTQGGDESWENARPVFAKAAALLRETEGPFFLGETVSYADLIYAGALQFMRRTAGESHFQTALGYESEVQSFYEACARWLERDNH
ncbi:conserved hypothetical protein [Verticillium alfalfae VaMs.102]|uniref:Uncharacterized protein n=1 Tax=Verticillium alfalfae (strain VaMs.102 / ATCC MYA-4576 / FGSC 10136) TaxID=526221 RepID=C9SW24_VERA1|nr:conserved hypothetical protein [Verticillium alfalfae VaMs.102]EEY22989.1 conserved hypothetical protein [Verticillium alfalfae VaMs.102]